MRGNPAVFAILFLIIAGYLMWNNFELPTIFFGKTAKTKGYVEKIDIVRGIKGRRYYQKTFYYYNVTDSIYKDNFTAGARHRLQNIGDSLLIEYSISNPSKNEVIGFYNK
jgi:hypothetical protein